KGYSITMDLIIPAGGIPKPGEPLYEFTQERPKALLDVAGKPMIQWVLDAVSNAKSVGRVVVVGLNGDVTLSCEKPLTILPNQNSMVGNIRAGAKHILEMDPAADVVMTASSDIPLVTGEMFDWFIEQAQATRRQFYIAMVSRQDMEARFPGVKRRSNRIKELELRGGDISIIDPQIILQSGSAADRLSLARGNVFKQLAFVGFDTLFLLLLRLLDLEAFVRRLGKRHGVDWAPILCPYPEIAMDIDSPPHLELLCSELSKRGS
ncbi:MAG: NTP transferase domain-containing protein, partial [Anaerolineales bacterium]